MALSGAYLTFRYVKIGDPGQNTLSVYGPILGDDVLTQAGTFAVTAVASNNYRALIGSVFSTIDGFITYGAAPGNPAQAGSKRSPILAGQNIDFFVSDGDTVRFAPAS